MAELRAALGRAGLTDVRTYIQSGNAVAGTNLDRESLEILVREVIRREIGADLAVIARTHPEIEAILDGNPFPPDAASRTYFTLLASEPAPTLVEALGRIDFSPDRVKLVGSTLYTLYATRHSDSKFNNNVFERKLKVAATTRNFNTLSRLLELTAQARLPFPPVSPSRAFRR